MFAHDWDVKSETKQKQNMFLFSRCTHLQKLNLSGCTQLMVPDIFTCMGLMGLQITTICLEGNQNVTDEIVQVCY